MLHFLCLDATFSNQSGLTINSDLTMKRTLLFLGLILTFVFGKAQLVTTSNLTVQQYVQDVLLGQNVTVSNITFNGGSPNVVSTAVGGFDCANCNLAIPSGFAMSTGDVAGLVGPNNSSSYAGTGTGGLGGSDPDLISLATELGSNPNINDWVIIEFDFIPLGDTIQFQYIWGSEEYSEWVNSSFNDIFGFFISGPGISGPYSNNSQNIALVPGTSSPVAINSINNGTANTGPCTSCEYYNQDGQYGNLAADAPEHTDPYYMQLDGYTDILTATAIVQCGETFHIKLAICDTGDSGYSSAVFLQRDSFSSNLVVQTSLELEAGGPEGNTMFENCGDGFIVFSRPESGNPNTELIANLEFSGTATMGVDYTNLPSTVTFAPGVMEVSLYIDAFDDAVAEGNETVVMNITNIAECGESLISSSFEFFIADVPEPLQVQGVNYEICQGAVQTLQPIITGGYANYGYVWSTGETTETIDVAPTTNTTYYLTVSDTCGMPSDNSEFAVSVLVAQALTASIVDTDNILPLNCSDFGNIYANVSGGIGPYVYNWTDDQGNALWGTDVLYVSASNAGFIYLTVTDECNFTATHDLEILVNAPALSATMPAVHTVTCGSNCNLTVTPIGGDTQGFGYSYEWQFQGATDWNFWGLATYGAPALAEGIITVIVSDQCGQSVEVESALVIESPEIILSLPQNNEGNCATLITINPIISGGSGNTADWSYSWAGNGAAISTASSLSSTFAQNMHIVLNVTDVCDATATAETDISIINPPIDVTLGDDINASCIDNTSLNADIQGGSGGVQYQWIVDGNVEGTLATFSKQSFATVDVVVLVEDACSESATDTVTIFIPDTPLSIVTAADTAICPNQAAYVWTLPSGGEGPYFVEWNDDFAGDSIEVYPAASTNYHAVIRDICGRELQDDVFVEVMPITANFNVMPMGNDTYEFTANPEPACPNCILYWQFGDGATNNDWTVIHAYDGLSDYTPQLTTINELGCANTQQYFIAGSAYFYIPNSFTPNGDGLNDVFRVEGRGFAEYEITIFNRWGNVIFHSTDPEEVWVGEAFDSDYYSQNQAYNFVIRVKGFDTETIQRSGSIKILR
jgi:gliding motility-associated-like protein